MKCSKQVKEVVPFGKIDMLKVVKFHKVKNQFSTKLKNDIEAVQQSKKKKLTFSGKTSNMHRFLKKQHKRFLTNTVTSTYKKADNSIKKKINMAGKQI